MSTEALTKAQEIARHRNVTSATIAELRKQWIANPAMPPYQRLTLGSICDIADAALRDAEVERILGLTDEEVLAEAGPEGVAEALALRDRVFASLSDRLCEDCPPVGYPTDKTRCAPCPRRAALATKENSNGQ